MSYVISRYFGLRAFGEIYSYAFALFTLGGVIGLCSWSRLRCHGVVRAGAGHVCHGRLDGGGVDDALGPYRAWEAGVEPVVVVGASRA